MKFESGTVGCEDLVYQATRGGVRASDAAEVVQRVWQVKKVLPQRMKHSFPSGEEFVQPASQARFWKSGSRSWSFEIQAGLQSPKGGFGSKPTRDRTV